MTKVAILFANYGPYHLARIKSFQEHCNLLGWKAVGIELTRSGIAYNWQTQLESFSGSIVSVVGDQKLEQLTFIQLLRKIYKVLTYVSPDVIAIAGYFRPAMLSALGWSMWKKKPAILLSESKEDDTARNRLKESVKSLILENYKAALVGGQPHKRYLTKLGFFPDAVFFGYNVVGNEIFHPTKNRRLSKPLSNPYFLAINRFIPKKNLSFLLSSYAVYRQKAGTQAWNLVLCGDGQLRPQLKHQINQLGLENVVHLPGFLQQNELLSYFAHAGCFIHASTQEQWGLVVNEAMAAGLPVLVSNRCGCYEDLVIDGVNGFGFDPEISEQLTDLMVKVSSGEVDREKMGQAALTHIQKFSPDYFAQGLAQAVEYALAHR